MSLRPFSNAFAVGSTDADLLADYERRLLASNEFEEVVRPAMGWVAAVSPLPESPPEGESVRSHGFVFLEGRDRLEGNDDVEWLAKLEDLADRRPTDLDSLPGDFSFLRFSQNGAVIAVRACAGLVPLYVHRDNDGTVALGTLLKYFPRFVPRRFQLDLLMAAGWASAGLCSIDDRSFLRDVSVLPRASATRLRPRTAPETTIYWDPRPEAGRDPVPDPEHPMELRRILISTLERDLDRGEGNLLTLSGGVDSSSLGALIRTTLGRELGSWSLLPMVEDPVSDREDSYVNDLAARVGLGPCRKVRATRDKLVGWARNPPGVPFPVAHPALCDLSQVAAEQRTSVLVGGEFADEVCGHMARVRDWADVTTLAALLTQEPPFGRRDYLRWGKQKALGLLRRRPAIRTGVAAEWVAPQVGAEYEEWTRQQRRDRDRDPRPLYELAARIECSSWVEMNWEATTPLGIRRSIPFFTREAVELAFDCHPSELLGTGPKRLLRNALSGDVPASWLNRPDKAAWTLHPAQGKVTSWPADLEDPSALSSKLLDEGWCERISKGVELTDVLTVSVLARCAAEL